MNKEKLSGQKSLFHNQLILYWNSWWQSSIGMLFQTLTFGQTINLAHDHLVAPKIETSLIQYDSYRGIPSRSLHNGSVNNVNWEIFYMYMYLNYLSEIFVFRFCLFACGFVSISTLFCSYLGGWSTEPAFLYSQLVITNFSKNDWLLIQYDFLISGENKSPSDSMYEINCHRDITSCPRIIQATPG